VRQAVRRLNQLAQCTLGQRIAPNYRADGVHPLLSEEADPSLVSARNDVVVRQVFGVDADEKVAAARARHLRRRPARSPEKAAEEIVDAHGGS
jgi:hypothetical protein